LLLKNAGGSNEEMSQLVRNNEALLSHRNKDAPGISIANGGWAQLLPLIVIENSEHKGGFKIIRLSESFGNHLVRVGCRRFPVLSIVKDSIYVADTLCQVLVVNDVGLVTQF